MQSSSTTRASVTARAPRDVVNVDSQLRDYECAITATRALDGVDPKRDRPVGARPTPVASSSPRRPATVRSLRSSRSAPTSTTWRRHCSWFATLRPAWSLAGLRRAARRRPCAAQARTVLRARDGARGSGSAYPSDDIWARLQHLAGPTWNNRIGLRDFLRLPVFRAVSHLDRLPCRIQFIACELDDLTPVAPTLAAAKKLGTRPICTGCRPGTSTSTSNRSSPPPWLRRPSSSSANCVRPSRRGSRGVRYVP